MHTKKQKRDQLRKALDAVDWAKLDARTDKEIEAAALSDPDNPPLSDEQLAQMRLVVHRRHKKPTAAE